MRTPGYTLMKIDLISCECVERTQLAHHNDQ